MENIFQTNLAAQGTRWILMCVLVVAAIAAGWHYDQLSLACNVVIVAFVLIQGVAPYLALQASFMKDVEECRQDLKPFQSLSIGKLLEVAKMPSDGACSLTKLIIGMLSNRDRMTKSDALQFSLDLARRDWEAKAAPLETASDVAPMLGLGGSLVGLLSGLAAMAQSFNSADGLVMDTGLGTLMAGMSTMITTTIFGCLGALLMIGLASRSNKAIDRHIAELGMVGSLVLDDEYEDEPDDDDKTRLFKKVSQS